jgi:post-segregation antitoxin (ccd killing protein)
MSRVNVYLPDDLAEAARAAGLNVSAIAQEALRDRLRATGTTAWLARLPVLTDSGLTHDRVIAALDEVRDAAGDPWPASASTELR